MGPISEDIAFRVDAWPRKSGSTAASETVRAPGGKGANPAVNAARLGASVSLIGAVGDDAVGARVLARLHQDGIDVSAVAVLPGCVTGSIVHLVESGRGRWYVEERGANDSVHLNAGEVQALCRSETVALISTALPLGAVLAATSGARAAESRIFLDVAGEAETARSALGSAYLVRGDAEEITALTAIEVRDFETAAGAARELTRHGPTVAVVQAGDEGDLVLSHEGELRLPRTPTRVVDTTGAGDALIAALTVSLGRGDPLGYAAKLGAAAARHAVSHLGGRPTFASERELRAGGSP